MTDPRTLHWVSEMICEHTLKGDKAVCACGWTSEWESSVGEAAIAWWNHAVEAIGEMLPDEELGRIMKDAYASIHFPKKH